MPETVDPRAPRILDKKIKMQGMRDSVEEGGNDKRIERIERTSSEISKCKTGYKKDKAKLSGYGTLESVEEKAFDSCRTDLEVVEDRYPLHSKRSGSAGDMASVTAKADGKGLPSLYDCAEMLKRRVRLIYYQKNLYAYNGKCYDLLVPDDVIRLYRERVDTKLGGEKSLRCIDQLHKYLCTDSSIATENSISNRRIAVLRNGIFDVMTGTLEDHSHNELVFSYINADYTESGKCKAFKTFLKEVTGGDPILQERIWQSIGYLLMQTTEAKVFFVMGEAPDSGKSLLGNFIESLFPEEYVSNIPLNKLNGNFSLAPIVGSAINISLDLPSTRLNAGAVSQLKMLTGGDAFTVNQKYIPEFRYRNRAKLLFATNFPIGLMEPDDAFWNRLVYLPFQYSVPKSRQDPLLFEAFQNEKDVIVSKALRHAKELVDNNFQFPTTASIGDRMQEFQGKRNLTVEKFLYDCCDCGENFRGELVDNLYAAYVAYCNQTKFVRENRVSFKRFLEQEIGLQHFKMRDGGDNPQSAFRGIKIKGNFYE